MYKKALYKSILTLPEELQHVIHKVLLFCFVHQVTEDTRVEFNLYLFIISFYRTDTTLQ